MDDAKIVPVNFDNIEKIAAFIIMQDGLEMKQKMHELKQAGYDDTEIDIGAKMAIQVCLAVVFGGGVLGMLGADPKKLETPKA